MVKRRTKIVDKKFQLSVTLKIMGASTLSFLLVLLIVGTKAIRSEANISTTIANLKQAVETENNIVKAFVEFSSQFRGETIRLATNNISSDHRKSIHTITGYIGFLQDQSGEYYYVIIAIIVVVVIQTLFYFFFLIRFTHRIAGPQVVINRVLQDLIDGKKPHLRELREKDELKELYEKLKVLAAKLEKKKPVRKKKAADKP